MKKKKTKKKLPEASAKSKPKVKASADAKGKAKKKKSRASKASSACLSPGKDAEVVTSYSYGRIGLSTKSLNNECCAVCLDTVCSSDDRMVCCSDCQIAVHKSCYGLAASIPGGWLCDACVQLSKCDELKCAVCHQGRIFTDERGGKSVVKAVRGGKWAHLACVLWAHKSPVVCVASHYAPFTSMLCLEESSTPAQIECATCGKVGCKDFQLTHDPHKGFVAYCSSHRRSDVADPKTLRDAISEKLRVEKLPDILCIPSDHRRAFAASEWTALQQQQRRALRDGASARLLEGSSNDITNIVGALVSQSAALAMLNAGCFDRSPIAASASALSSLLSGGAKHISKRACLEPLLAIQWALRFGTTDDRMRNLVQDHVREAIKLCRPPMLEPDALREGKKQKGAAGKTCLHSFYFATRPGHNLWLKIPRCPFRKLARASGACGVA